MNIEQAARAERAAEQNREQAEAAWRSAWWGTTLALAEPPDSDRKAVTAAYDTAERILGQSRHWLAARRRTGIALKDLVLEDKIFTLPPRLAVEYVRASGDPAQAAARLRDAEKRELSLRDLAAELGTQPKSWLREGEQDQRPVTPEQVRRALASPEVAKEVFADPDAAGDAVRAAYPQLAQAMHNEDRRKYDQVAPPGSDEAKIRENEQRDYEMLEVLQLLHRIISATGRLVSRGRLTEQQAGMIAPLAQRAKAAVDYLATLEQGDVSLDDELAAILKDEH